MKDSLGERIKAFRESKKLTQVQFGLLLGFSPMAISRVEGNHTKPTKIAKRFNEVFKLDIFLLEKKSADYKEINK